MARWIRRPLGLLVTCVALTTVAAQEGPQPPRKSELRGNAFLGRNRPVVGATVQVRPEGDWSEIHLTSSDAKGTFKVFDLNDGDYRVEIDREGLTTVIKNEVNLRFPFRAMIDVPMESGEPQLPPRPSGGDGSRSLTLTGEVVERGNEPLTEISLRFVRPDGTEDPRLLRSDTEGRFSLSELVGGEWELIVKSRCTIDPCDPERLTYEGAWGDTDPFYYTFKENQLHKIRIPAETQLWLALEQEEMQKEQISTTYLYQNP